MYCMHCKCDCLDYFYPFLLAKVRRLYDIANVLTSLGLIKKVHVTEERGRKPAFKWIGPVEFPGKNGNLCSSHLLSFSFDNPVPSGNIGYFLCVKNGSAFIVHPVTINCRPAQHLPLLDFVLKGWSCGGMLKDTVSCWYFYTNLHNCRNNCMNCRAVADYAYISKSGSTAFLDCKISVILS